MLSGLLAPESNVSFDKSLKLRSDGVWGIKDIVWVTGLADERGLELTDMAAMPANNFFVTFTKVFRVYICSVLLRAYRDICYTRQALQ